MIKRFDSIEAANSWAQAYPGWKPISVSAGHLAGSILVVFERVPLSYQDITDVTMEVLNDTAQFFKESPEIKKRRGRPPKVRAN